MVKGEDRASSSALSVRIYPRRSHATSDDVGECIKGRRRLGIGEERSVVMVVQSKVGS